MKQCSFPRNSLPIKYSHFDQIFQIRQRWPRTSEFPSIRSSIGSRSSRACALSFLSVRITAVNSGACSRTRSITFRTSAPPKDIWERGSKTRLGLMNSWRSCGFRKYGDTIPTNAALLLQVQRLGRDDFGQVAWMAADENVEYF